MQFRQSAVRRVTHESAFEESYNVPRDILPAMIGSGEIALALDPLGMQGYNVCMPQYRDAMTLEGHAYTNTYHLHVYRGEAMSNHYFAPVLRSQELCIDQYSHLPCGYLEYDLEIDGRLYSTEELLEESRDWERSFTPRNGELKTSFTVGNVRIHWTANSELGNVRADFLFEVSSLDEKEHGIKLLWRHILRLRDGKAIAKGGIRVEEIRDVPVKYWRAETATSTATIFRPIEINWALLSSDSVRYEVDDEVLTLAWTGKGTSLKTRLSFVTGSDRNNTLDLGFIQKTQSEIENLYNQSSQSWVDFFESSADIEFGDEGKEYLMATSQYVLRAGAPWHSGVPLGNLWSRKFGAMTFWDTFYAADGMLRAGHVDMIRDFAKWLDRTSQNEGRPHTWMTYYDGTPGANPKNDIAYINCLAYSGILIRLAEWTGCEKDLKEFVFPYMNKISKYLMEEVFECLDGVWTLKGEVAGDVGIERLKASEQTDTIIWASMTLAKAVEYAEKLGETPQWLEEAKCACSYYKEHPTKPTTNVIWYPWLPYLAPAGEYADYTKWWDGSIEVYEKFLIVPGTEFEFKQIFGHTEERGRPMGELPFGVYMGMPWSQCSTAASFLQVDQPDLALEFFDGAFKYVSGLGYLTESPYELNVGGHSPYIPSHGAYLSALQMFIVKGTIWKREVEVCTGLPLLQRGSQIKWKNVYSLTGVKTSGLYTPRYLNLACEAESAFTLKFRIPFRIAGETISVELNGESVDAKVEGEIAILEMPAGKSMLEVTRELNEFYDILVVDPLETARPMVEFLKKSGRSVRWLRDYETANKVANKSKVVFLDVSYAEFPDGSLRGIFEAVEKGATLIGMYHAGVSRMFYDLAKFLGVNADYTKDWEFKSELHRFELTPEGKEILSGLEDHFEIDVVQEIIPDLAEDVQVLAMDLNVNQPALTLRKVGLGNAIWMSPGCKQENISTHITWALAIVRGVFTTGKFRGDYAKPKWVYNEAWRTLVLKILDVVL